MQLFAIWGSVSVGVRTKETPKKMGILKEGCKRRKTDVMEEMWVETQAMGGVNGEVVD